MRFFELKSSKSVSDPKIKQIQQILMSMGYDLGPTKDDGVMGPYTDAAIKKYLSKRKQSNNKIDISGDIMPANGPVSGHYGRLVTGPNGKKVKHPGVDIAAPSGSPVVAPKSGRITYAGWGNTAGNLVELITDDGEKHRFMHLSKILVKTGDSVEKGRPIGAVGNTGYSKGAHLHWEKYVSGKQINPLA
jgi:murein DD-endopeptidase MepM/ murein hydrolase activator NlpD